MPAASQRARHFGSTSRWLYLDAMLHAPSGASGERKQERCLVPDSAETELARARQDRVLNLDLGVGIDRGVAPGAVHLLLAEDRHVERIGPQAGVENVDRGLEALGRRGRVGVPVGDDDAAERVSRSQGHEVERVERSAPQVGIDANARLAALAAMAAENGNASTLAVGVCTRLSLGSVVAVEHRASRQRHSRRHEESALQKPSPLNQCSLRISLPPCSPEPARSPYIMGLKRGQRSTAKPAMLWRCITSTVNVRSRSDLAAILSQYSLDL